MWEQRTKRKAIERAQRYSKIQTEYIGVIAVPADAVERGRQYKVDVERGVLVPASEEERHQLQLWLQCAVPLER